MSRDVGVHGRNAFSFGADPCLPVPAEGDAFAVPDQAEFVHDFVGGVGGARPGAPVVGGDKGADVEQASHAHDAHAVVSPPHACGFGQHGGLALGVGVGLFGRFLFGLFFGGGFFGFLDGFRRHGGDFFVVKKIGQFYAPHAARHQIDDDQRRIVGIDERVFGAVEDFCAGDAQYRDEAFDGRRGIRRRGRQDLRAVVDQNRTVSP